MIAQAQSASVSGHPTHDLVMTTDAHSRCAAADAGSRDGSFFSTVAASAGTRRPCRIPAGPFLPARSSLSAMAAQRAARAARRNPARESAQDRTAYVAPNHTDRACRARSTDPTVVAATRCLRSSPRPLRLLEHPVDGLLAVRVVRVAGRRRREAEIVCPRRCQARQVTWVLRYDRVSIEPGPTPSSGSVRRLSRAEPRREGPASSSACPSVLRLIDDVAEGLRGTLTPDIHHQQVKSGPVCCTDSDAKCCTTHASITAMRVSSCFKTRRSRTAGWK